MKIIGSVKRPNNISGGDALRGNTRSHPELETVRESRWLPGYKKFISGKEININVRTPCGFATLCSGD